MTGKKHIVATTRELCLYKDPTGKYECTLGKYHDGDCYHPEIGCWPNPDNATPTTSDLYYDGKPE